MRSSRSISFLKATLLFGSIAGALWVLLVFVKKEIHPDVMRGEDMFWLWIPITHALSLFVMMFMVRMASVWYNEVIKFGKSLWLTSVFSIVAYFVFIAGVFTLLDTPGSLERALEETLLVVLVPFVAFAVFTSLLAKKLSRNPAPPNRSGDILDEDLL